MINKETKNQLRTFEKAVRNYRKYEKVYILIGAGSGEWVLFEDDVKFTQGITEYKPYYPPKKPKRIPFDLERAKKGDPIITRNGGEARFIGVLAHFSSPFPVKVEFVDEDNDWSYGGFTLKGTNYNNQEHKYDLFMKE